MEKKVCDSKRLTDCDIKITFEERSFYNVYILSGKIKG